MELSSVFEKLGILKRSQILISRVPFRPGCQDGHFGWFPGSHGPMVWSLELFFCKVIDFFPGSVVVFEKSVNW